jgi:hypothetical protein
MANGPMFVITIDTEPDNEWARPAVTTTANARFIPPFQDLCERFGFKVTYLLTLQMAEDEFLREYLPPRLEVRAAEAGAHPHPWNTPPLIEVSPDDNRHHPYVYEYPTEVQRAKLETLVGVIERNFGVRPVSYKTGRWGLDGGHARILQDLGFLVDSSVCPGKDWRHDRGHPNGNGGPDYRRAPLNPYSLSHADVCQRGSMRLWEVPPTIVFYSAFGRNVPGVRELYWRSALVRRAFDWKRNGPEWLRPYPHMTIERLCRVATVAMSLGAPVLNLTFHFSELMPGGSPHNRDKADIESLYRRLEGLFEFLQSCDAIGLTLSEARDRFAASRAA